MVLAVAKRVMFETIFSLFLEVTTPHCFLLSSFFFFFFFLPFYHNPVKMDFEVVLLIYSPPRFLQIQQLLPQNYQRREP